MNLRPLARLCRQVGAITALYGGDLSISQAFSDHATQRLDPKTFVWVWRAVLPDLRIFKESHLVRTTARATHSTWPADADKELKSVVWIAEILNCFQEGSL